MSVYVLYRNNAVKCKVSMERTFAPGDKFRFDGADCIVDKVVPEPAMSLQSVFLVDVTVPKPEVRKFHRRKSLPMASND